MNHTKFQLSSSKRLEKIPSLRLDRRHPRLKNYSPTEFKFRRGQKDKMIKPVIKTNSTLLHWATEIRITTNILGNSDHEVRVSIVQKEVCKHQVSHSIDVRVKAIVLAVIS